MGNIDMLKLKKIKILSLLVYLERIAITVSIEKQITTKDLKSGRKKLLHE